MTSASSRLVRIGSATRTDAWGAEKHRQSKDGRLGAGGVVSPGPGDYLNSSHTFGQSVKGGYMAGKYQTKAEIKPGPGQYETEDKAVRQSSPNVRIGQAERHSETWMAEQ